MLLVAIPKSASTSLMRTLGRLHGLAASQTMFPTQPWPSSPEFHNLARFHSDARQLAPEQPARFATPDAFHKQHVVPTDHNLELLAECAPVVLVRPATDIVSAYRRADRTSEHPPRPAFKGLNTEEAWQARAVEIGLVAELERFADRWSSFAGSLVVEYDRLVTDPDTCMDAIEGHWGLPPSPRPVELARERYTRIAAPRRWALRCWRDATRRHGRRR